MFLEYFDIALAHVVAHERVEPSGDWAQTHVDALSIDDCSFPNSTSNIYFQLVIVLRVKRMTRVRVRIFCVVLSVVVAPLLYTLASPPLSRSLLVQM